MAVPAADGPPQQGVGAAVRTERDPSTTPGRHSGAGDLVGGTDRGGGGFSF